MSRDREIKAVIAEVIRLLREERERQQLSMNEVAARAGLSQSMMSLMERNLRNPTLDTLLRVTNVLNVELGKIISQANSILS